MNDAERRELIESLIAKWRESLSLGDWDIRYSPDAPDEDSRGATHMFYAKQCAKVHVDAACPDEVIEEIVVHELLHVVLNRLVKPWENIASHYLSKEAQAAVQACIGDDEEVVIHHLMTSLIGHGFTEYRDDDPWAKAFGRSA